MQIEEECYVCGLLQFPGSYVKIIYWFKKKIGSKL